MWPACLRASRSVEAWGLGSAPKLPWTWYGRSGPAAEHEVDGARSEVPADLLQRHLLPSGGATGPLFGWHFSPPTPTHLSSLRAWVRSCLSPLATVCGPPHVLDGLTSAVAVLCGAGGGRHSLQASWPVRGLASHPT